MKNLFLLFTLVTASFFASASVSALSPKDLIMKRLPGEAYDSSSNSFLFSQNKCVTEDLNNLIYVGENTGQVSYYYDQSTEDVVHNLHLDGSGGVETWILGASAHASLAREFSSSNTNLSLIYEYILQGKTAVVDRPVLSDLGIAMTQPNILSAEKRKNCGDSFVSGIHLGARFLVNAKLFFRDEATKNRFEVDASIEILKKTFTTTLVDQSFQKVIHDASIQVSAVQYGGSQTKFDEFIKTIGSSPSCSISNLTPCKEYFQKLLTYSQTDFPNQLNDMKYSIQPGEGPIPLSYEFSQYSDLGFRNLDTTSDTPEKAEEIAQKDAAIEVQNKIDEEFQNNERANQFLLNQSDFMLTTDQINSIQTVAHKSQTNLEILRTAQSNCAFPDQKSCISSKTTAFSQLLDYDVSILSPQRN